MGILEESQDDSGICQDISAVPKAGQMGQPSNMLSFIGFGDITFKHIVFS